MTFFLATLWQCSSHSVFIGTSEEGSTRLVSVLTLSGGSGAVELGGFLLLGGGSGDARKGYLLPLSARLAVPGRNHYLLLDRGQELLCGSGHYSYAKNSKTLF